MSVIVLTDICQLSCEYCFYSTVLAEKKEEMMVMGKLNKDDIYFNSEYVKRLGNKIVDSNFEVNLGKKSVVITGGEPTLHPEFIPLMRYFIEKGLSIHLLTNFGFPQHGKIYKYLLKNKKYFRFLVNFNEISKQKNSASTKANLIDFDDENIKIGINVYHKDYYFDDVIEVLNKTKNIQTIRLGLPNTQVDEGINMGAFRAMKEAYKDNKDIDVDGLMNKYRIDLFEDDIKSINEDGITLPYGLYEPTTKDFYYTILGNELRILIMKLKENNLEDRINFYIDCGFDYKIIPEDVLGFLLQRLSYKNPCSIPNGSCIQIGGETQQCYAIGTYGNFTNKKVDALKYSIRDINNYYLMSSSLLQHGLLNQKYELNFEQCRGNNLRFFKQLFTKGTFNKGMFVMKDYKISQRGDSKIGYELKDINVMTDRYLEEYKKNNEILFLIRIYQLIEYCLAHEYFEEANIVLGKIRFISGNDKTKDRLNYFIFYYYILSNFMLDLQKASIKNDYAGIEKIRNKYIKEVEEINTNFNQRFGENPNKQLKLFEGILKIIILKQKYIC